jgi:hypothetical protein
MSLITFGSKMCVSPSAIWRELPNSVPAAPPEARSSPVGDEPSGKLPERLRSFVDLL